MNLIIVESPTKAKTLSRFLGKGYSVEATMGHVKDLPKSKLGVDVDKDFKPDYIPVEKRAEQVAKIEKEAKKAKNIYIATDPDREGEAIAQHIEDILRENSKNQIGAKAPTSSSNSKLKRIVFHEITKEAVEEALSHPRAIDKPLVDAQIARRVLDRLVGYNLSPLLWRKVRRGLSAGRVQSVTVRLIVEKEREIEKFKAIEYWEIFSVFGPWQAQLYGLNGNKLEIHAEQEAKAAVADLEKSAYLIADVKKREVRKNPYPPFTTSTMTQAGARHFGWSAKRTMSLAQRLYEQGLITYHRTDSTNIAQTAIAKVRPFIQKEYGEKYLPASPRLYKTTQKVAQEAHEAIRPTDINSKIQETNSKLEPAEQKLYGIIWRRFVASQMNSAVYDETTIEVEALRDAQGKQLTYNLRTSGQIMKFDGWKALYKGQKAEDGEVILPNVQKGDSLVLSKVEAFQKFTQPPARFNEASLIKTLEKLGIGRPSTYAPTISTIQIRSYVEKKDAKFFPTPVGIAVNDFLVENFDDIIDYQFTAGMEDDLDKIADGKREWVKTMKTFWTPFTKKLVHVGENAKRVKIEVEKLGKKCPTCSEGELVIRTGRFGKFISCSRFPECKHTEKYMEKIEMKCPDCKTGEVIVKKTRKGRTFFGCSRYPECKFASWTNPQKKKEEPQEVTTP